MATAVLFKYKVSTEPADFGKILECYIVPWGSPVPASTDATTAYAQEGISKEGKVDGWLDHVIFIHSFQLFRYTPPSRTTSSRHLSLITGATPPATLADAMATRRIT